MTAPRWAQKRSRPFGARRTPFNPLTGTYLPLGDVRAFVDFTIVQVGHDFLLCEGADDRQVLVAKPWQFRKTAFDGETFGEGDEVAYASTGLDRRKVTEGSSTSVERVSPAYCVGERIVAMRKAQAERVNGVVAEDELEDIPAGDYTVDMEDLNTAGRRWLPGGRVKVTALGDNTLTVKLLEDATAAGAGGSFAEGAEEFAVWKPWDLQRQSYDALTIGGVTYAYVGEQERTGDDGINPEETQIVVPPYFVGSVLFVAEAPNGAAPGAEPRRLMDMNVAARFWCLEATP